MTKRVLAITFAICFVIGFSFVHAQNTTTRFFIAYDYENLTVDDTSGGVPFTSNKVTNTDGSAASVTFTVACDGGATSCPFRMTLDSTSPTTTVGMRADYGSSVTIYSHQNIQAFRAIREGSTSAILNVTYFK